MGELLQFGARRHGRASAGSVALAARAAKSANVSAVKPAARALPVARIALHQSAGMLLRCSHLRADAADAPISRAKAAGDGHRLMIERNEVVSDEAASDMESSLGQIVLNCKAILSYDCGNGLGDNGAMPERLSETEETAAYIGRVRKAREAKFRTPKPVYEFLGVPQDHYKDWETKRPMPRRFVPKFCTITEVGMEWLLTGEGKGPVAAEIPKHTPQRARKAARGRAA